VVVATAGKVSLTLEQVESRIPAHVAETVTARDKQRLVEGWLEKELLYQEALRQELELDPRVAARVESAKRELLVAELLEREYLRDSDVSDEEIRAYYETHLDEFTRDQPEFRARHILVGTRSELDQARARLRKGEMFDQVARDLSVDESGAAGGDLGYFTEDMVDFGFWATCDKAKKGRRVTTVTRLGHHIVEVLSRREVGSTKELLEVWDEVQQRILSQRRLVQRRELLDELKKRIPWSIRAEAIEESEGEELE
jgi:parvulin-like peptidyl-prolyl isomerase